KLLKNFANPRFAEKSGKSAAVRDGSPPLPGFRPVFVAQRCNERAIGDDSGLPSIPCLSPTTTPEDALRKPASTKGPYASSTAATCAGALDAPRRGAHELRGDRRSGERGRPGRRPRRADHR